MSLFTRKVYINKNKENVCLQEKDLTRQYEIQVANKHKICTTTNNREHTMKSQLTFFSYQTSKYVSKNVIILTDKRTDR